MAAQFILQTWEGEKHAGLASSNRADVILAFGQVIAEKYPNLRIVVDVFAGELGEAFQLTWEDFLKDYGRQAQAPTK